MKKILCLLALFITPAIASAQAAPVGVAPTHGLTLAEPEWVNIGVSFTGFGDFGNSGGGGPSQHFDRNNRRVYTGTNPHNWSPNSSLRFGGSNYFRAASVSLTNAGARTVKSVRLEFVFKDPSTGAEVLRLRHRTTKKLKPGVSKTIRKEARASRRVRRGDGANLSVEVTEVRYTDGTVWRRS